MSTIDHPCTGSCSAIDSPMLLVVLVGAASAHTALGGAERCRAPCLLWALARRAIFFFSPAAGVRSMSESKGDPLRAEPRISEGLEELPNVDGTGCIGVEGILPHAVEAPGTISLIRGRAVSGWRTSALARPQASLACFLVIAGATGLSGSTRFRVH